MPKFANALTETASAPVPMANAARNADDIEQQRRGKYRSTSAEKTKHETDDAAGTDRGNDRIGHDPLFQSERPASGFC